LLLVNLTGGHIGEGEGIGVAVFLTFFFFFLTGFLVALDVLGFLVALEVLTFFDDDGLAELFVSGFTVAFFDGVALLLGFGFGVGVAACTFVVNITEHNNAAKTYFNFILDSI
jgi:hypothetical protein